MELCDWLDTVTLPDGGVPFAVPVESAAGCAPFWADADPNNSSLQISAIVTAMAHRAARHDPAIAAHPWLKRATDYCLATIEAEAEQAESMALAFALPGCSTPPAAPRRRRWSRSSADGSRRTAG